MSEPHPPDSVNIDKERVDEIDVAKNVTDNVTSKKVAHNFPVLKRRRCRSLSKAENIVTEEEKIRRAQPDKP
jgi:hypothetical protein